MNAAIGVSVFVALLSSQTADTLDLTVLRPATSPPEGPFAGPTGGRFSGTPVEELPLEISLVDMDRADYRMSDPVVFRVRIRNVGSAPFPLPWEPDWTRIAVLEGHRITGCTIWLEVDDEQQPRPLLLFAERVFGSSSTAGTLRWLAPGHIVDWIVPTTWRLGPETVQTAFVQTLPRTFSVRAALSFDPQPVEGSWYSRALSANSVAVTLSPPDRPQ